MTPAGTISQREDIANEMNESKVFLLSNTDFEGMNESISFYFSTCSTNFKLLLLTDEFVSNFLSRAQ